MALIDLSGKVALVTGGSRGIGAATAVMLASAGAKVGITYRTRQADAGDVLEDMRRSGEATAEGGPMAVPVDLSRREDIERAVQAVVERFGRLDVFVANAGIWPAAEVPVRDMGDDRWMRTVAVNLTSIFHGCRKALQVMSEGGRIVIVSSTAGQRGEAYHADYAATKGAIIAFVKSLAVEAAPSITVNAVAPGWVDTEMCNEPFGKAGGRGRRDIEATIPLGRVASPQDIAGPIVFLCSELGGHVTGEVLNVNGGSVLCG